MHSEGPRKGLGQRGRHQRWFNTGPRDVPICERLQRAQIQGEGRAKQRVKQGPKGQFIL